ncbi:MAG: DUF2804 domain-containing protein [Clostridia bacterium]|nr:DUF2804 domain-containing protein [Clostridia bacterium]
MKGDNRMHTLSEGPLLNEQGALAEAGRATALVKRYDRRAIRAGRLRIKEWDYYLVHNERCGVALTIADNAYMGLVSASFLDFEARSERTVSPMFWFPLGKTGFPASSKEGDVQKALKGASFAFRFENGGRRLTAHLDRFGPDGSPFDCDILLTEEPQDSMVIATPFPEKKTAFYYNQKIIGMRAEGSVSCLGRSESFSRGDAFGLLDWGRGVWTYENTWYWGAGMGLVDGHTVGFNIGYGFGDTSAASENMLFYDGRAHPFERVQFHIPEKDGRDDFLSPWTFSSSDGRFQMDFVPILDRAACTDVKLILSDQHQVFGRFTGTMILDDGQAVALRDFLGFAEKVHNKW